MSCCFHFYNHILILLLFINQARTLCSSRKYPPPPPHGRDFSYDPHPLGIFQNRPTKWTPSPLEIPFFPHTPSKYCRSLWKPNYKLFFSTKYRISILTFFSETFGGYCDQHITRRYVAYLKDAYRRICDMKIIDFIPSIPLHNFDKTAVT